MLIKHKINPSFMFQTSKGLRRFINGILHLENEIIDEIKNTEDYKNGFIEIETETETETETKNKSKKRV